MAMPGGGYGGYGGPDDYYHQVGWFQAQCLRCITAGQAHPVVYLAYRRKRARHSRCDLSPTSETNITIACETLFFREQVNGIRCALFLVLVLCIFHFPIHYADNLTSSTPSRPARRKRSHVLALLVEGGPATRVVFREISDFSRARQARRGDADHRSTRGRATPATSPQAGTQSIKTRGVVPGW